MAGAPGGGKFPGRKRLFRAGQQGLEGLMRDRVNVFVGRAGPNCRLDQMLVAPVRTLDDRHFERAQGRLELGLRVGLRSLHRVALWISTARANSNTVIKKLSTCNGNFALYGSNDPAYTVGVQLRSPQGGGNLQRAPKGGRVVALAFGVALAACGPCARAQLMMDYVSPCLFQPNQAPSPWPQSALARADADEDTIAHARPDRSPGGRWEKFEAEFGINNKSSSLMKGSLESAKYQLDKTTFALQEFVDNFTDAVSFDYGWNDLPGQRPGSTSTPRPTSSNPLFDSLANARLKSDIDLKVAGGSFVGLKLVMPFGD